MKGGKRINFNEHQVAQLCDDATLVRVVLPVVGNPELVKLPLRCTALWKGFAAAFASFQTRRCSERSASIGLPPPPLPPPSRCDSAACYDTRWYLHIHLLTF